MATRLYLRNPSSRLLSELFHIPPAVVEAYGEAYEAHQAVLSTLRAKWKQAPKAEQNALRVEFEQAHDVWYAQVAANPHWDRLNNFSLFGLGRTNPDLCPGYAGEFTDPSKVEQVLSAVEFPFPFDSLWKILAEKHLTEEFSGVYWS